MSTPPLGWISPQQRTQQQADIHEASLRKMPKFAIPGAPKTLAKGEKVILADVRKHPLVVQDVGFTFTWFYQWTGSCIGVSLGNMLFDLGGVQRLVDDNPTKAFVSFWPFNYGRSRFHGGFYNPGEGAMNSAAVLSMTREGVLDIAEPGLPAFVHDDHLSLTRSLELQWSDGDSPLVMGYMDEARKFPLGGAAAVNDPQAVTNGLLNGYPGYFGCNNYASTGEIRGSGAEAYVRGRLDEQGGHSTGITGVWHHPNDGMLYLYQNSHPRNIYPTDPAGGPPCSVWLPESELLRIWSQLDGRNEFFMLSHLTYFAARPKVLEVFSWVM